MSPNSSSAPTLHDVAREANVSLATASRVLNGSSRKVAEAYRERVVAAAERLGYTANLSAQAIARGTSATIALLVADIADPYFGQIAAGVARGADEAGLVVTIATTERDVERETRLVRALRGQRPRALILAASRAVRHDDDRLAAELEALAASGCQVVGLGPGVAVERWIRVDNRGGATALAEAMRARGYRRAVVIAAADGLHTSDERLAGFRAGFEASGGEILDVVRTAFSRSGGIDAMTSILSDGLEPETLVFAVSDVIAIGAMSAMRERGLVPGTDAAVCGFDDIPTGRDVTPGLTTVRIPLEDLGHEAARAAVDSDWTAPSDALALDIVIRDSTPPITAA